ncbi:MAG TPA: hypothetical protein VJL27_03095 [Patescibacteria group bacterium]|nr:hypothetical protein [Patescibacteria group bacterium]
MVEANGEMVNTRIDRLEEKMDIRFSEHDRRFDVLEKKVDRIFQTENEDIAAALDDISSIKSRLRKANI